jgi:hypothetical protein
VFMETAPLLPVTDLVEGSPMTLPEAPVFAQRAAHATAGARGGKDAKNHQ